MWSWLKQIISGKWYLAALFLLAACGFQPMYGANSALSSDSPLSGNLVIDPIGGREGQIFRNALEDKLNPQGLRAAAPDYRLHATLAKTLIPAVVQGDGTIQRYNVRMHSEFVLLRTADNKTLLTGHLDQSGSYNVTINANFATYEAEQDVIERNLQELAENYMLRLSGYFAGKK